MENLALRLAQNCLSRRRRSLRHRRLRATRFLLLGGIILATTGCPLVRATGNAVEATGEGVAHAVEGTGDAVGQAGRELAPR